MKIIITTAATLAVGVTLMLNTGVVHAERVQPVATQLQLDIDGTRGFFTFGQIGASSAAGLVGGAAAGALATALFGTPGALAGGIVGGIVGAVEGAIGNVVFQLLGASSVDDPQLQSTVEPALAWD